MAISLLSPLAINQTDSNRATPHAFRNLIFVAIKKRRYTEPNMTDRFNITTQGDVIRDINKTPPIPAIDEYRSSLPCFTCISTKLPVLLNSGRMPKK